MEITIESDECAKWAYYKRSAGQFPETSASELLRWVLQQITLGNWVAENEGKDVVTLTIGRGASFDYEAATISDVKRIIEEQYQGFKLAGLIAQAREQGTSRKTIDLQKSVWDTATPSAKRKMEIHYAHEFCHLLEHLMEKLPRLDLLPIVEKAPKNVRFYLAEATRCYLFRLDRACVALCRACLEDTLKNKLTSQMRAEWQTEIASNKKQTGDSSPMLALIDVCARHGVLGGFASDAHFVRQNGNKILHSTNSSHGEVAAKVLHKTRAILGFIYS